MAGPKAPKTIDEGKAFYIDTKSWPCFLVLYSFILELTPLIMLLTIEIFWRQKRRILYRVHSLQPYLLGIKRCIFYINLKKIELLFLNSQVQRRPFIWRYCHQMPVSHMESLLETRRCKSGNSVQECLVTYVLSLLWSLSLIPVCCEWFGCE